MSEPPLPDDVCGYKPIKKLGSGTYGVVYLATKDKTQIAIKKALSTENWLDESIIKEIDFLNRFDHPNVARALETHVEEYKVCLVMEYFRNTLADIIRRPRSFEEKLEIFRGTLCGLQYLHTNWVIHGDLKPENILIEAISLRPVIADFGLSINFGPLENSKNTDPATTRSAVYQRPLVTTFWRPPEFMAMGITLYLDKFPKVYFFGPEIDVYSMSWIGMELLFGIKPPLVIGEHHASYKYLMLIGENPGPEFGNIKKEVKITISEKGGANPEEITIEVENEINEYFTENVKDLGWDPYGGTDYFATAKVPANTTPLFDNLKKAILSPPDKRPTAEALLSFYPDRKGCEKKIEYQPVMNLDTLAKSKCFDHYTKIRSDNVSNIKRVIRGLERKPNSGIMTSNSHLIELETIDLMDRLYASFISDKMVLEVIPVISLSMAIALYGGESKPLLNDQRSRDIFIQMMPKMIEVLKYKIYRPSLAQLGLSIKETLKCYEEALVPVMIELESGVCSVK